MTELARANSQFEDHFRVGNPVHFNVNAVKPYPANLASIGKLRSC